MVSFGEQNYQTGQWDHHCGGAIISKNAIATASHCFFSRSKGYNILTKIRTGDQNFADNTDDDFVEVYDIATIIKHPEYRGYGAKHDLAIVFTKQEIDFNVTTSSILVPSIDDPIRTPNTNYSARFSGYGYYDDTLIASDALREADFTIFTGTYCEPLFGHRKVKEHLLNTSILMCAGTDVSTCFAIC